MTDKNAKNERAYELYRAMSDVDERYVGEMLDDDLAERIRAANMRKRITVRSFVMASAAVVALVIGIGVVPNLGKLNTVQHDNQTVKNGSYAAELTDEDNMLTQDAATHGDDDYAEGEADAAPDMDIVQLDPDTDGSAPEGFAEENEDYGGYNDNKGFDGDTDNEHKNFVGSMPPSADNAEEGMVEYVYDSGSIASSEEQSYTIMNGLLAGYGISEDKIGDEIGRDEEKGYIFYKMEGIYPPAGAAVYVPETDSYMFAVNDSFAPQTLRDVFYCFGFDEYLNYGAEFGKGEELSSQTLEQEFYSLMQNAYSYKRVDGRIPDDGYYEYKPTLGDGDQTYCEVSIVCHESGFVTVSIVGIGQLWKFMA